MYRFRELAQLAATQSLYLEIIFGFQNIQLTVLDRHSTTKLFARSKKKKNAHYKLENGPQDAEFAIFSSPKPLTGGAFPKNVFFNNSSSPNL